MALSIQTFYGVRITCSVYNNIMGNSGCLQLIHPWNEEIRCFVVLKTVPTGFNSFYVSTKTLAYKQPHTQQETRHKK